MLDRRGSDDGLTWEALMRAANAGDGAAYARLLHAVTPTLRGIVRARAMGVMDPADCEDVVQTVLLTIHLKRQTWRPDAPLRPWLYAITRHKVTDALRARGRRGTVPLDDWADVLPAPDGPDLSERRDALMLMDQLSPREAQILQGAALHGETSAETGQRLGMSEGAVRVALHRALKRLAVLRKVNGL